MAKIQKKHNGKFKVMLTEQELNVVTIALAHLSFQDIEKEIEEQGLTGDQITWNVLGLSAPFMKETGLFSINNKKESTTQ